MKWRAVPAFILSLFIILPTVPAAAKEETNDGSQEWILQFKNDRLMDSFISSHPNIIEEREGSFIKAAATKTEIQALSAVYPMEVQPNYIKKATSIQLNDTYASQQWGLDAVSFDAVQKKYPVPYKNLLLNKTFILNGVSFPYEGLSLSGTSFSIQINGEKLSRLSLTLDHSEGNWGFTLKDEHGSLIAENSGSLQKLDVFLPKDKNFNQLYISLHFSENWNTTPKVNKVTGVNHPVIAVIDSGVSTHDDLCENILTSLGKDYKEGMDAPIDQFGHGTHVTGILAACTNNGKGISGLLGNAPVDILPLKVLDKNGLGGDFEISQAVNHAVDVGAAAINLSLAGKGQTTMLEEAVKNAFHNQIPVIAAAGNWNISTESVFPASYPYVLTVSGLDPSLQRVGTSDYGWEVDLGAPGINILSTYLDNGYKLLSGTSMAAPVVTAAAILAELDHPGISLIELRDLLFTSTIDTLSFGFDQQSGYGLVYLNKILKDSMTLSRSEWLTLKNGEPVQDGTYPLAVSPALIGDKLHLFINEQLISTSVLKSETENIELPVPDGSDGLQLFSVISDGSSIKSVNQLFLKNKNDEGVKSFSDVPKDYWAGSDIEKAAMNGFINGYADGRFKPNDYISRKHAAMMMDRVFRWTELTSLLSPFHDVSNELSYSSYSVMVAYQKGIINGYPDGNFKPESHLTRSQMALILSRALPQLTNVETSYNFSDLKQNSETYTAVQKLAEAGIITKQPYFKPNNPITRAQFAAMIMRTYRYLDKNRG
ncbi:S8 family peptidase [Falsibacillus pallidus]|uniref:S8 family peptidase n=1 Tax=Falsibacillus pallidus TaxID=493781 RepID=UPI003D9580D3